MKVWVAIYEHCYGYDIRVFDDAQKAEAWREQIARYHWSDLGLGDLLFDAEVYWDNVQDEWFNYNEYEVE